MHMNMGVLVAAKIQNLYTQLRHPCAAEQGIGK